MTLFSVGVALLWLVSLLAGCDEASGNGGSVEHPIRDSLSIDPDDAVLISRDGSSPSSTLLSRFAEAVDERTVAARMGLFDGDSVYVFGEVTDARFLPDGSIAVLDRQTSTVRVFDPRGRYRYSIGGSGEGPGELSFPVALVLPTEEELWIVDGARMIHRFTASDGRFVFRDRVRLDGFARDACAGRRGVVVNIPAHVPGELRPEILYRFDEDALPEGSFAAPYRYRHRLAFDRMARVSVACTLDRVVAGFEFQNRLDAYRVTDGGLLWHASFDGIRLPRTHERVTGDGRRALRTEVPERGSFHFLLGVVADDDGPVVVQFGRRDAEEYRRRVDRYVIESFAVDPETGEGTYLGEDLPRVLAIDNSRVAFLETDPYPRLEVVHIAHPARAGPSSPDSLAGGPQE